MVQKEPRGSIERLETVPGLTSIHRENSREQSESTRCTRRPLAAVARDFNRALVETEIQSYRGQDVFGRVSCYRTG